MSEILPRRGRRVLIYGVAPHVVIVPYYDGRRWRARIYAATFTRDGLIRWCGRIKYFYLCYTVSIMYCSRRNESRNMYYELRVCTILSEPILDRYVIVRRAEARSAYLGRLHRFINAVANLLINMIYDRFYDFVTADAGPEYVDAASDTLVNMLDVVAPIMEPPCGIRATSRTVRPMPRTYYFVRCRCPAITSERVESALASLTEYMPSEQLEQYVIQLMRSWKALGLPGDPATDLSLANLEEWLSKYAGAIELRRNCKDITNQAPWLIEHATYVRTHQFFRDAFRLAFG